MKIDARDDFPVLHVGVYLNICNSQIFPPKEESGDWAESTSEFYFNQSSKLVESFQTNILYLGDHI